MKKEECVDPKVSIVIPVYNGEKYIKYAIDSALAQTYKNSEIIVVDDGSTDKTEKIVKTYGDKVRYIKKENGGVSSALNLAIEKMRGEYFSWLSHDDTYEPNKIEAEIRFLQENGYIGKKVIVFSDYYLIDAKGKLIAKSRKDHEEIERKPEYTLLKGHINGLSLLIPKSAFDMYGGFDTKLLCTQDYVKWKEMTKSYRFIHIPELLVSTRWHTKQVTNTSPAVLTEGNAFYRELIDEVPKKRKEELEGSEYCFYKELARFYKGSVYTEVEKYCLDQAKKILDNAKKQTEKKVSVVIPFYNRCEMVMRAVNSVLNQTYKNYEILLINDGSDKDISKIEKLVKRHKNIKLFKNERNLGASASRNIGINKATGEYIAFLDSDDCFEPNKLEVQMQYVMASNANISHTSYKRIQKGKETIMHSGENDGHCERKMIYNCPIATPTVILRTEWIKNNKIVFKEDATIGEDTCFWLDILRKGVYLVGIDEPLTVVNVGDNAAAYSDEKQVIGLKTIIKYLLNDDYYSKYDKEISLLMKSYIDYVNKVNEDTMGESIIVGGPIYKLFFFLKTEGVRATSKRVLKKTASLLKKPTKS